MIYDHYWDKWQDKVPQPVVIPPYPQSPPAPAITPEEILEFRRLLDRARKYDQDNNEPDCELAEKKERLRKLAEELGVKISFDPLQATEKIG